MCKRLGPVLVRCSKYSVVVVVVVVVAVVQGHIAIQNMKCVKEIYLLNFVCLFV